MITPRQALLLLAMLEAANLKPGDAYQRPGEDGLPSGRVLAGKVYAAALNAAGVTFEEAEAAVMAYIGEPDPGQYPKPFPDPGKIIARTPHGRAALTIGSDDDSARAFRDFCARMKDARLCYRPSRDEPARHLDPEDPYRNDAMHTALEDFGGASAWGARNVEDPFRVRESEAKWRASYRAARARQGQDRDAVRFTARRLLARPVVMLGVGEAK